MGGSDSESVPASSHSKKVGEKKRSMGGGDDLHADADVEPKRVKMRDLEAVLRSEYESVKAKETPDQLGLAAPMPSHKPLMALKRCSSVLRDQIPADLNLDNTEGAQILLDLASSALSTQADDDTGKLVSSESVDKTQESEKVASPVLDLDLNVADASNMDDYNPFHPYKKLDQVKPINFSECGSTTGSLEDNGSLKVWKEIKRNGFLSVSHGGIPLPKKRGRPPKKRKEDEFKKAGVTKKELANRFGKAVVPSGLLSGLNPGIINHVRNGKQVRSIIEAILKSEKFDRQAHDKSCADAKDIKEMRVSKSNACSSNGCGFIEPPQKTSSFSNSMTNGLSGSQMADKRISLNSYASSCFTSDNESNALSLKLASVGSQGSGNGSGASNDEISASQDSISSLSLKGAHVASQWLQLLHQDIKGRFAALRRSRKRVRSVIQLELPHLLALENMPNQENNMSQSRLSDANTTSGKHYMRWKTIFSQMERALSEEGKHLEIWMEQVKEMQVQCNQGIYYVNAKEFPLNGPSNAFRFGSADALERESAVKAAAASIYSTCNFAMSTENVPCC